MNTATPIDPDIVEDLWREASIPLRHANARAGVKADGKWGDTFATCKAKIGTGCLFALVGPRGTGKTQLAIALLRETVKLGKHARYVRLVEFYMDIKETWQSGSKNSEGEVIAQYCRPTMLVIDEAHERGEKEWASSLLNLLIDKRYAAMRDTILIANGKSDDFGRDIGASISSRMNETGGVIACDWESFRK